jgi:hypothetical protein
MQRESHRAGRGVMGLVCVWVVLAAWAGRARGEPYIAVREGYKCSQCHTNITGGGKRNGFGLIYTQTTLPHTIVSSASVQKLFSDTTSNTSSSDVGTFVGSAITDFLSVGGDLRVENRTVFAEGPLETRNDFSVTEANLYVQADLLRDFLTLYVDERLAPGAANSREVFGLIHLPQLLNFYLKGGKFFLPFGWRLQDDSAFIRDRTGINYATPDIGVEVGIEPGPVTFSLAVSNGTAGGAEDNLLKQVTLRGEVVFRHWRIGGSFAYNETDAARRVMYGSFAGLSFGRITLLGEADLIADRDAASGNTITQLAVFSALNVLVVRGVNFMLSYEFLDPDIDIDHNARTRLVIGIEPFLTQFFQMRLFYRRNDSIPQRPAERADEVRLEMHLFF